MTETYKDVARDTPAYTLDRDTFDFSLINSAAEAFVALYGLIPEHYLRWWRLGKISTGISQDDKDFRQGYIEATANHGLDYSGISRLLDIMEHDRGLQQDMRRLPEWTGDFKGYLQALYDAGMIFPEHAEGLTRHIFSGEMHYSMDAKPRKIYQYWIEKKKLWRFDEASCLYGGSDPEGHFEFINLRADSHYFNGREQSGFEILSQEVSSMRDFKAIDYHDLARRHIDAGTLKVRKENGEEYFEPKVITKWFLEQTKTAPPPVLVDLLHPKHTKNFMPVAKLQEHVQVYQQYHEEQKETFYSRKHRISCSGRNERRIAAQTENGGFRYGF